jgi:hypothetical protein
MNISELEQLRKRVASHASEKELEFLASAQNYFTRNNCLTTGQLNWVASIATKYSEEKLKEESKWLELFTDDHREKAIRVANYYSENPPYFQDYVSRINSDPGGFVLSLREWKKFCENKYAKKILNEYESEPKFSVGQTIQIRATNKVRAANYNRSVGRIANKVGFILQVDAKPITRAAKGSRVYKVLLSDDPSPLFCHEADLKTKRG